MLNQLQGAITVNSPIKSVSAVKPPKPSRDPRQRRRGGRIVWKTIESYGDHLVKLGKISKEAQSCITRFVLFHHLTPLQGEAAKRYAYMVARFEKYCTEGRRTTKSQSYEKAFGSDQEIERRIQADTIGEYEAAARKAKKEYDKLMKTIAPYGATAKSALDDFCCSDIEPAPGYRENLAIVLGRVVKAFGITEKPRRRK